jgi:AcrR family transcriptional regulator
MVVETGHLRADARRNRERIVATASACFAADGLGCQVAEIARRAGVGNATVFRHFPTKHDLLIAVFDQRLRSMLEAADAAEQIEDPGEGLRTFLEELVKQHVSDNGLKQLVAEQFKGDERLGAVRDEILARLSALVDAAKAAGAVRPDVEPIDCIVLVNGVANAVSGLEEQRPGLYLRYLEMAFAGIRPQPDGTPPLPATAPTPQELEDAMQSKVGQPGCVPAADGAA